MDPTTEAVLFDRMVCAEASDADWRCLEAASAHDPAVWRRLAHALQDHGEVVQAVALVGDVADAVDLPRRTRPRILTHAGWFAAAAVAAVWAGTAVFQAPPPTPPPAPPPSAQVAEVVQELPAVLIDTRALPEGQGVEVTYLRRTVEKRQAKGLFEQATDEWGDPVVVPAELASIRPQEL